MTSQKDQKPSTESCPPGWKPVSRQDPWKRHGEIMANPAGCNGVGSRVFCCPPTVRYEPYCGWYGYNNGACSPGCGDDFSFEVGSLGETAGCYTHRSETACCRNRYNAEPFGDIVQAMDIWNSCRWLGLEPDCGAADRDVAYPRPQAQGDHGSGSTRCWQSDHNGKSHVVRQEYYCKDDPAHASWEHCYWLNPDYRDPHKTSKCGMDETAIAFDSSYNDFGPKGRDTAYCCTDIGPRYTLLDTRATKSHRDLLSQWAANPTCPARKSGLRRREDRGTPEMYLVRDDIDDFIRYSPDKIGAKQKSDWDDIIGKKWEYMKVTNINDIWAPRVSSVSEINIANRARAIECSMDAHNQATGYILKNRHPGSVNPGPCPEYILRTMDPDLFGSEEDAENISKRSEVYSDDDIAAVAAHLNLLDVRTGGRRKVTIDLGSRRKIIRAADYINGNGGQNLANANGDSSRYATVVDDNTCTYTGVTASGSSTMNVHAEHIIELQTMGWFFTFLATGSVQPGTSGAAPILSNQYRDVRFVDQFLTEQTADWDSLNTGFTTPADALFNEFGSLINSRVMVNCQATLNLLKARVWGNNAFVSDDNWNARFRRTDQSSFQGAMRELYLALGVWDYLNNADIQTHMQTINAGMQRVLTQIGNAYIAFQGFHHIIPVDLPQAWSSFMTQHMERTTQHAVDWLNEHVDDLIDVWDTHQSDLSERLGTSNPPTNNEIEAAHVNLEILVGFKEEIKKRVSFPAGKFKKL